MIGCGGSKVGVWPKPTFHRASSLHPCPQRLLHIPVLWAVKSYPKSLFFLAVVTMSPIMIQRLSRTVVALKPTTRISLRFASTLPPRSTSFTKLNETNIQDLRSLLTSKTSLISTLDGSASEDDLAPFNNDWMNKYHGHSQVVVKPKTVEQVSAIMKYCHEKGIAVVPQGGNTGLVGKAKNLL